jgi:hypothetical protein
VGKPTASGTDHVPARAYCGPSPAWEFVEDLAPRLALFLVSVSVGLTFDRRLSEDWRITFAAATF